MNKSEILDLILLKQEGSYWDFKREWYFQDKKADLLHDIICMANNLSNRDAYIIVGVDGAVKKSATKPVDSLDMEAHGL